MRQQNGKSQCNSTVSAFNCPKCPDGIISCSDKQRLCEYTALPSLKVSYVDNVCHLTNLDADLNIPVDSNFSYYAGCPVPIFSYFLTLFLFSPIFKLKLPFFPIF